MPSVIAMIRSARFAASATRIIAGMHVHAVADQLGDHLVALEHRAGETRRAMADRRHAIEEMRRLPRAGANAVDRLVVGRARVSERHVMPVRDEIANQIDRAVELGRDRDDADVRARRGDFGEDVVAGPQRPPSRLRRYGEMPPSAAGAGIAAAAPPCSPD